MFSAASSLGDALVIVTYFALHLDASTCMVTVALVSTGRLNVLLLHGGLFGIMGWGKGECLYSVCLGWEGVVFG